MVQFGHIRQKVQQMNYSCTSQQETAYKSNPYSFQSSTSNYLDPTSGFCCTFNIRTSLGDARWNSDGARENEPISVTEYFTQHVFMVLFDQEADQASFLLADQ